MYSQVSVLGDRWINFLTEEASYKSIHFYWMIPSCQLSVSFTSLGQWHLPPQSRVMLDNLSANPFSPFRISLRINSEVNLTFHISTAVIAQCPYPQLHSQGVSLGMFFNISSLLVHSLTPTALTSLSFYQASVCVFFPLPGKLLLMLGCWHSTPYVCSYLPSKVFSTHPF